MSNKKNLLQGFNNENLVFLGENGKYILRTHKENVRVFEKHSFPEKQILLYLQANNFPAPIFVSSDEGNHSIVLKYIEGNTIEDVFGPSGILPDWIPLKIIHYMVSLHGLDACFFEKDFSRDEFFSAKLEEYERYRLILEKDYPGLFKLLLFPTDFSFFSFQPGYNLSNYLGQIKPCLCHFDINRKNVIIRESGVDCVIIDWETADMGDPLCDVAIHLQKMRYAPENERLFLKTWLTKSKYPDRELEVINLYRNIEAVKYAYTDVVRILEIISNDNYSERDAGNAIIRYYNKYYNAFGIWDQTCPFSQEKLDLLIKEYAGRKNEIADYQTRRSGL